MTTTAENIQAEKEFEQTLETERVDTIPSPFIPGTNIQWAWDSTSIGLAKGCPRLYYYTMIRGFKSRYETDVHLRFGLAYHSALEEYDRQRSQGVDHLIAMREAVRTALIETHGWKSTHDYKNKPNLIRTIVWYLDRYGDKDPAKTVQLNNGRPAVEVTFRFELDWGPVVTVKADDQTQSYSKNEVVYHQIEQPYTLCGHLDRIVDYQGARFVMDRKTTKSQLSDFYFTAYDPDNQMTLYTLAGKIVLGAPIRGVVIDGAQVLQEESKFGRGITYRTPDQLEEWLTDLKYLFAQYEDYAAEGYWPMNDRYCGTYRSEESGRIGCPFRSICSKNPGVRENFLKSEFEELPEDKRWNPLRPR